MCRMCTRSGSKILMNGQMHMHDSVCEEHCGKGQRPELMSIFFAKRALFSHSSENDEEDFACFFLFFPAASKYL